MCWEYGRNERLSSLIIMIIQLIILGEIFYIYKSKGILCLSQNKLKYFFMLCQFIFTDPSIIHMWPRITRPHQHWADCIPITLYIQSIFYSYFLGTLQNNHPSYISRLLYHLVFPFVLSGLNFISQLPTLTTKCLCVILPTSASSHN